MKHRKLRIAWSVAWGIACVLLFALWASSYRWGNSASMPLGRQRTLGEILSRGNLTLQTYPNTFQLYVAEIQQYAYVPKGWEWTTTPQPDVPIDLLPKIPSFHFASSNGTLSVGFPIGLLALIAAFISGVSWSSLQFSLHTLLITTTVIAASLAS
jgi:hypothetical protein